MSSHCQKVGEDLTRLGVQCSLETNPDPLKTGRFEVKIFKKLPVLLNFEKIHSKEETGTFPSDDQAKFDAAVNAAVEAIRASKIERRNTV